MMGGTIDLNDMNIPTGTMEALVRSLPGNARERALLATIDDLTERLRDDNDRIAKIQMAAQLDVYREALALAGTMTWRTYRAVLRKRVAELTREVGRE